MSTRFLLILSTLFTGQVVWASLGDGGLAIDPETEYPILGKSRRFTMTDTRGETLIEDGRGVGLIIGSNSIEPGPKPTVIYGNSIDPSEDERPIPGWGTRPLFTNSHGNQNPHMPPVKGVIHLRVKVAGATQVWDKIVVPPWSTLGNQDDMPGQPIEIPKGLALSIWGQYQDGLLPKTPALSLATWKKVYDEGDKPKIDGPGQGRVVQFENVDPFGTGPAKDEWDLPKLAVDPMGVGPAKDITLPKNPIHITSTDTNVDPFGVGPAKDDWLVFGDAAQFILDNAGDIEVSVNDVDGTETILEFAQLVVEQGDDADAAGKLLGAYPKSAAILMATAEGLTTL